MSIQRAAPPNPELLARFAAIVGKKYAVTDPAAQAPYLVEMRGLYHGRTQLVLRPGATAEVAAILRLANETRTPIVPQGGNTGLVGGQIPLAGELVLSLTRLDRIREVDPISNTMTCEPRVVLANAQGVASPRTALALLNLAEERAGGAVTSFELMPRIAVEFALRHGAGTRDPLGAPHPWYVLIELSSAARDGLRASLEELLAAAAERGLLADAAIAASIEQAQSFWHLRNLISETQRPEGGSIKHDVSVPVAAVPEFIEAASAAVQALIPGCRPVPFGHLGDGNVHFNVSQPVGADKAEFLAQWGAVNARVHEIVGKFHGSISAEHGIGRLKRDVLPHV